MNTSEKGLNFKFFKDQRILGPLPPQYSVIIEITVKIRKISVIEFVYVFIYVQNLRDEAKYIAEFLLKSMVPHKILISRKKNLITLQNYYLFTKSYNISGNIDCSGVAVLLDA